MRSAPHLLGFPKAHILDILTMPYHPAKGQFIGFDFLSDSCSAYCEFVLILDIEDDQWNIMENRFMNFFPTYFGGRGFNPTYFGGRGFKKIGEGDRRKRLFGLSPFSSYQPPKAQYRRPNRNVGDRLQVIRLKRNNIQDLQHLGEALKVIRL